MIPSYILAISAMVAVYVSIIGIAKPLMSNRIINDDTLLVASCIFWPISFFLVMGMNIGDRISRTRKTTTILGESNSYRTPPSKKEVCK